MTNFRKEVFYRSNPYKNQTKREVDGKICQNMKFTTPSPSVQESTQERLDYMGFTLFVNSL